MNKILLWLCLFGSLAGCSDMAKDIESSLTEDKSEIFLSGDNKFITISN